MAAPIRTTYYGPTDAKGSRIAASTTGRRITVGYDYALNEEGNHRAAMLALCLLLQCKPMVLAGAVGAQWFWEQAA